ncbi:MAG: RNA polymerase sigma factor [Undibacterium sp.]|nr:RNA polymerase sigma factor [Opitutaceae bacterium]
METMPALPEFNELELLSLAREGDQAAYGRLVSRYQTLVASLAYSICGDFARSQDIAQEAFIAAWRQLGTLNDPSKFKSWLCGITRNLGHNFIRQQTRRSEQTHASPETTLESASETPGPHEQAVTREEAIIVWRALEQLPENYREPLVLFYREHQSVERVAAALDLSEETVKQRLSRGRGMLRAQMEHLVERSLGFTTPGALFTTAVLGALPALATPLLVAGAASVTAKSGAAAKAALSLSTFIWLGAPLIQFVTIFIGRREALRFTSSPDDRRFIKRLWVALGAVGMLSTLSGAAFIMLMKTHPDPLSEWRGVARAVLNVVLFLVLASLLIIALWAYRPLVAWNRTIRLPDNASPWRKRFWMGPDRARVYRSRLTLLGLPLLDIRFGHSPQEPFVRGTARGWIALGDTAHGVILAVGGVAIGGIAIGGCAIGGLSLGALTFGLAAFGGLAVGGITSGLAGFGYVTSSLLAMGFETARGGIAIAVHFAQGPVFAAGGHANDFAARHGIEINPIMRWLDATQYLRTLSTGILIPVVSFIVSNFLVRFPQSSALENPSSPLRPNGLSMFRVQPAFVGLLTLSFGLVACLLAGAAAREARTFIEASDVTLKIARTAVAIATNDATRSQARYDLGKALVHADRTPEALDEFLGCFDEGVMQAPGVAGIRRISLLNDIKRLGEIYAPAQAALLKRRERTQAAVLTGQATNGAIADLVALNQALGEADQSLALYDQLAPTYELRPALGRQIFPQLLRAKRYHDVIQAEPSKAIFLQ